MRRNVSAVMATTTTQGFLPGHTAPTLRTVRGWRVARAISAVALLATACTSRRADPPASATTQGPTVTSHDVAGAEAEVGGRVGLLTDFEVRTDDGTRVYDLYVPATNWDDSSSAPVVVLLHGQRSSRSDIEGGARRAAPYRQWQAIADANQLLLLIPQGSEGPNGHAGWNDCRADAAGNPEVDDVAFVTAALAATVEDYAGDADRVFAVGTSNGGHMAIRLAMEQPEAFSGIGVVAAGMPSNSTCPDSDAPVSSLFMWGTEDPLAPYDGGAMAGDRGEIMSAESSIRYWVERNGTSSTPTATAFADIDAQDASIVERLVYEDGTDDTRVALYRVDGGGHTEPSIAEQYRRLFLRVVGEQNHDIEMAVEVWQFFDR